MKPDVPLCNCGRRGTPHEGHCIYCMEKDADWRIWQQVKQIMADARQHRYVLNPEKE